MAASTPLLASLLRNANGTQSIGDQGNTTSPIGRRVDLIDMMVLQLTTTSHAGTNPTLDVYVQHSVDGGTTWDDFIHFPQVTTSEGTWYAQWFRSLAPAALTHAKGDAALAAGTVLNGPVGDDWRLKWAIGGTASPSYTFTVLARQISRTR